MATTENLANGTGSQTDFAFTFPYIKASDIKVSVGGVVKTVTTHYTLHNATTIKFTSGNIPPSGTNNVRVYRETDDTSLAATFYPGSGIKAGDLNENFTQNLYVVQEGNNKIDSAWQTGDETIISTETWHTSDDTRIGTTKAIENRINSQIDTAIEGDVLAGTDLAKTASGGQVTINHSVSGANSTVNNSDGTVIQDITISAQGHVTSVGSKNLNDVYFTETELTGGALDGRYYTETEVDANFYKIGSAEEIASGETWAAADNKVATTAAIDARIVDLVDDVGGFVPIANETSFPNANPDVNNGAGTLVSIKAIGTAFTSNGSGVATIANGTVGNSTVTINGLAASTTYNAGWGMIVETTTTLNTYTFHRQTPKATEVSTVAANVSNVNSVASNITNINTVNSNVTNINSVATNLSNINAVAGQITFSEDLGLVSEALTTGSGNNIDTVAGALTNINTVAGANSNITTVSGSISNINSVAGSISNVNSVASNLSSVNSFAATYRIASSAPSSSLDEGDLWYDSTANSLKYYNGTTWTVTAAAGLSNMVEDTTPELGGHLDCNDKNLTEVGTVSGDNLQIDFGTLS
jgi:hypothetical protein